MQRLKINELIIFIFELVHWNGSSKWTDSLTWCSLVKDKTSLHLKCETILHFITYYLKSVSEKPCSWVLLSLVSGCPTLWYLHAILWGQSGVWCSSFDLSKLSFLSMSWVWAERLMSGRWVRCFQYMWWRRALVCVSPPPYPALRKDVTGIDGCDLFLRRAKGWPWAHSLMKATEAMRGRRTKFTPRARSLIGADFIMPG